jgi:hypothetical protein
VVVTQFVTHVAGPGPPTGCFRVTGTHPGMRRGGQGDPGGQVSGMVMTARRPGGWCGARVPSPRPPKGLLSGASGCWLISSRPVRAVPSSSTRLP